MANVHEEIKWKVITDFTKEKRGRLYCSSSGLAILWADYMAGIFIPKWFGPLKRKFKGFPDTMGFEYYSFGHMSYETLPIFCVVEVKTKGDSVKPAQRRVLSFLSSIGARVYIAWEADNERGYILKEWDK